MGGGGTAGASTMASRRDEASGAGRVLRGANSGFPPRDPNDGFPGRDPNAGFPVRDPNDGFSLRGAYADFGLLGDERRSSGRPRLGWLRSGLDSSRSGLG
jgi:hypothetical protein